jgi:DNA-binding NtrC family response regulator
MEQTADGAALKKTALVVDDEESIRTMCQDILTKKGYNVLVGSNGADFVKMYNAPDLKIDFAMLDNKMPEKTGLEALAEVYKPGEDLKFKVIMISGDLDEKGKQMAMKYGVADFLPKPFVIKTMLEKIKQYDKS